ncbi:hypothetical protein ABEV00_16260 [Paenibacillus thiaminolyticus]|uniref:hypothetical protein n=1 Tax=Paenibacillus thiaminolyticus TaxID=49283 RepID=UPI003D26C4E1
MAKVGDVLKQPETGWKRYDDSDGAIKYIGDWPKVNGAGYYKGSLAYSPPNSSWKVVFTFHGTKIRIIAGPYTDRATNHRITIDGETEIYSERIPPAEQALVYEKTGLSQGTHFVEIEVGTDGSMTIDAIDIDDNGWLIKEQKFLIQANNKKLYTIVDGSGYKEIVRSDNRDKISIINEHFSNPENAFDKNVSTSADTAYITPLKKIGFRSQNKIRVEKLSVNLTSSWGKRLELEGSDDGSTWIKLNDTNFNASKLDAEILINNTREFYYYRVVFYGEGSFSISLKELQFYYYSDDRYLKVFESANDDVFIRYGLKKGGTIPFSKGILAKMFFVNRPTSLGSGKVFKQKIDTSKIPIKKVSIE